MMQAYLYSVKGRPYDNINLKSHIMAFVSEHEISDAIFKETRTGFTLEIMASQDFFSSFEPILLKKLIELIDIQSYSKRKDKNHKQQASHKQSNDKESKNQIALKTCIKYLIRGDIIAIKEKNGFHILSSASKAKSIQMLRDLIKQPTKPLPVVFKNMINMQKLILLSKKEQALLTSQNNPLVLAKMKNLHRLDRDRYKYVLSPLINPINKRISVSLASSKFYDQLFQQIAFPLISIDAQTQEGVIISEKRQLLETYGDRFKYIFDDQEIEPTKNPREVYQIMYGQSRRITPPETVKKEENTFEVVLDFTQTKIADMTLAPLKILLDENHQEQPKYSALSLLFAKLPIQEILTYDLPFTVSQIESLYENWTKEINTTVSTSFLTLFDAIASLSRELHEKSFQDESVLLAEAHFEVCAEDVLAYHIEDNAIEIDVISAFLQNRSLKHLASTLVYTISTIICDVAKEKQMGVTLNGRLLRYRDLTELTIEKLEDENLLYFY